MKKIYYLFMLSCLLLSFFANNLIFTTNIGISYPLFIIIFYTFFFYRFKHVSPSNKQITLLLFFVICMLSVSYFIFSNIIFYVLNYIFIPLLMYIHSVLYTTESKILWYKPILITFLKKKMKQFLGCYHLILKICTRRAKRNIGKSTYHTTKKIAIGLFISIPVVFIVLNLLLLADDNFAHMMYEIPQLIFNINYSLLWDTLIVITLFSFFITYFIVLRKNTNIEYKQPIVKNYQMDTIIVATFLTTLNIIYLLFVVVQFQYFFSGTLETGLSYAEYARRGFFELMIVTIINYITLLITLHYSTKKGPSFIVKVQLSLMIMFSAIMLASAFIRLAMYEQAYGFTMLRVLVYAFMIYLTVLFAYTLMKVWVQKLSIVRFSIIFTLLFYVGLNIMHVDQMIVNNNLTRYEETGKIDIHYLGTLSYSAVPALVDLYESEPHNNDLKEILIMKDKELSNENWKSFNISRVKAREALKNIKLD
ncbi:DUF4153 domain-containing protein [Evansella cellulosilytica]|uniref:Uncharacterized protein n=1 Tax=Evansella cellulosilytica (strain ATCC 21833 / DSM 2522 / FERM P-1141 / JCM 9156 / N-4) TaxID=649639 RepID=E6TQQ3_EVAC2|nr:DUF4173 domain-containing protein [Evansella cellulosilytica]ADU30564.1 hypothetical protein Bcell_2304 [Evansella cellulosilytica DSM 2522]